MVDECGIEVIDPIPDGVIHHRLGLRFVNQVSLVAEDRQAHTAKAQDRELLASLSGLSIEHTTVPSISARPDNSTAKMRLSPPRAQVTAVALFLFGFAARRLFNSTLNMTDSGTLLAEYVKDGSEPAFRELVTRYVDLVYSAAVRLVEGDRHLAEDVAQTVFADLARLARSFPTGVMLGGWLHRHTCYVAATLLRGERRRRARERQAVEMNALQDHSEANLALLAPLLDEAINQLGRT